MKVNLKQVDDVVSPIKVAWHKFMTKNVRIGKGIRIMPLKIFVSQKRLRQFVN